MFIAKTDEDLIKEVLKRHIYTRTQQKRNHE